MSEASDPAAVHEAIRAEVATVLVGNEDVVEHLAVALLSEGHVLLEGVPGVAKTTIAELFARATGLESSRIQLTPDTLPADVTGSAIYREATGEFEVRRGPVFANLVVADEVNRATPKTQSALLEAMQERRVTIDGEPHELPDPFLVIATQNPIEMEGTFELPEAQRDRFQLRSRVDVPDRDTEAALLSRFDERPDLAPQDVEAVVDPGAIPALREAAASVHVAPAVADYLLDVVAGTREHGSVAHGASPRAALDLQRAAKARAAIRGREYVLPDDVKALAVPALAHRLVLRTDAALRDVSPEAVIEEVLAGVEPPGAAAARASAEGAEGARPSDPVDADRTAVDSTAADSAGDDPAAGDATDAAADGADGRDVSPDGG